MDLTGAPNILTEPLSNGREVVESGSEHAQFKWLDVKSHSPHDVGSVTPAQVGSTREAQTSAT